MTNLADLAAPGPLAADREGFRVLVVDDDPDMAAYLSLLLENEGMAVDSVGDGSSAAGVITDSAPDLVLLDVLLPDTSGFDLCRRLKSDPATALVPVVLVTALEDHESRISGIQAGADDFLTKPVRREELVARVQMLRRLHDTRRELEARRLAAEVQRKEAIRKAFSRYISPRLAERIVDELGSESEAFGEPHRVHVVALFADLRGFTRLTESVEVGEVVAMLNEYFEVVTEAAYRHEGTIFSMAGDSLLVGFNVPFPQPDAPERAWRTAQDMIGSFARVLARCTGRGAAPGGIGLGIASGEAIIGNIGSPHYMSYTVIGDAINTAARLTQMAEGGEVLLAGPVHDSVRGLLDGARVTPRGMVALRGKSEPVAVYSVRP